MLIVGLLLYAVAARAGDYPFYFYLTQHTQNQLLYNPAYAGTTDKLNLHLHSMTGLYKVTGTRAAVTPLNAGYLAFDRPCTAIRGAWGAYVLFDAPETAGRYYTLSAGGNYAYRWQINEDHRLQFGAGINYRRWYADQISTTQPNDPIFTGRVSTNHLDFSLGTWYQFKKLNAGISLTHFGNFHMAGIGGDFIGRYDPVFNFYASYDLNLIDKLNFEPYLYFATADKNAGSINNWSNTRQFSIGFMADFNKAVFAGFGYSHDRILSPTLGFQLKKMIRFQGTYNYVTNQQSNFLRYHNFEISLTVQLPHRVKEKGKREK